MSVSIAVLHGPNLNLLGTRKPEIFGSQTLEEINRHLAARARELGVQLDIFHSNHEGALIDEVHRCRGRNQGIILNPGGLSHTSVALRDALAAVELPTVEVHLSNVFAREEFRLRLLLAPVCRGVISGLGADGYVFALEYLSRKLAE